MVSGSRTRKGKRERGRDGSGGALNHNKAAQSSSDKRAPSATDDASKQVASKPSKSCVPNSNVHQATKEEEMTATVCWICAEPIEYYSLPSCNHRTCHVCALRLRALYDKIECTFCKKPQSSVIFTTSRDADFSSFTLNALPHKNAKLAIFFQTESIMEETLKLFQFNCPGVECDYIASGWGGLKLHARAVHGKVFCDLCIRFKKVFPHEHVLYMPNVLPLHLPLIFNKSRQPPLNEVVEGGIHPLCAFCNKCFFDDDEMFVHMREEHEECFLCKRNEIRYRYYQNYDSLEQHFSQDHFACADSACQAQKFVVFDSELDLNAHRLEVHSAEMSLKDRREARRVQFEPREGGSSSRRAQGLADRGRLREPMRLIVQTQSDISGMSRSGVEGMSEGTRTTRRSAPGGRVASAITPIPESLETESGAHELISAVWEVLDQNMQGTAKIVNAVVNFLDEEEKKNDLLATWNEYEIGPEHQYPSYDFGPTDTPSRYANTMSIPVSRIDWLDHHVLQPSNPSSPTVSISSVPTSASLDPWGLEAFPSLARPRSQSTVTPQSQFRSHKPKSWASVAALSHLPSSPTTSKKADAARQPPASPAIDGHPSPLSAGPSFDVNVTPAYHCPFPPPSPRTWSSLVSSERSPWTPGWTIDGSGSVTSEVSTGQGKKGKGKQKQRATPGPLSF